VSKPDWPIDVQAVRILDVLVIGPLMFWGGMKLYGQFPARGATLAVFGLTTIGYNAVNYAAAREPEQLS
jgi:hypothetical protein